MLVGSGLVVCCWLRWAWKRSSTAWSCAWTSLSSLRAYMHTHTHTDTHTLKAQTQACKQVAAHTYANIHAYWMFIVQRSCNLHAGRRHSHLRACAHTGVRVRVRLSDTPTCCAKILSSSYSSFIMSSCSLRLPTSLQRSPSSSPSAAASCSSAADSCDCAAASCERRLSSSAVGLVLLACGGAACDMHTHTHTHTHTQAHVIHRYLHTSNMVPPLSHGERWTQLAGYLLLVWVECGQVPGVR